MAGHSVPKFTIVTVCYNCENTIENCARSVMNQQDAEIEHLIVDGGSTDGTVSKLRSLKDWGSDLVSEPDDGIYDAMNKGLERATGEYIGFLNADDRLASPGVIARMAQVAAAEKPAAVQGDVIITNADFSRRLRYYSGIGNWKRKLSWGQMPPHPAFYVRTEDFRQIGSFAKNYKIAADYDFMIRFFLGHGLKARYIDEVIVEMADGGVSNQGLSSRFTINAEILQACRANNLYSNHFMIWSKYFTKIFQFGGRDFR